MKFKFKIDSGDPPDRIIQAWRSMEIQLGEPLSDREMAYIAAIIMTAEMTMDFNLDMLVKAKAALMSFKLRNGVNMVPINKEFKVELI